MRCVGNQSGRRGAGLGAVSIGVDAVPAQVNLGHLDRQGGNLRLCQGQGKGKNAPRSDRGAALLEWW